MSKQIVITQDQFVSKKGAWTTYIDSKGTQVKARNVFVQGSDESARSPAPKAAKPVKNVKISSTPDNDGEGEEGDDHDGKRRVGNTWHDCRAYEKSKSAAGNKTLDSGDQTALALRGKELEHVYKAASKALGESLASLKQRYEKLNPGMQRMNLGNRMRAAARKLAAVNDPANA